MGKKKLYKAILIVLTVSVILIPVTSFKAKGSNTVKYTKVIVYPGDTLWSIASKHNYTKADIRKIVHNIRTANNLESAVIMPGQELVIPLQ